MGINVDQRIQEAIELGFAYGGIDGSHHKQWVIDQMIRILAGDKYLEYVEDYEEEGEYVWDEGIEP